MVGPKHVCYKDRYSLFAINAHNLLVRAKPKLAVSQEAAGTSNWSILTMCAISICITNNITITVYVMA